MTGYDLVQVPASPRIRAASCRVCGEEFVVAMSPSQTIRDRAIAMLARHIEGHSRDEIVRVYVLGEPWWKVMSESSDHDAP